MDIIDEIRADREAGALRLEREYKPRLLAVAARFCPDETEAEALVYRTIDEAIRCIETLSDPNAFFGWMCGIMSNQYGKLNRRKIDGQIVYTDKMPEDEESGGAESVVQAVDATLLREAVEGLPDKLREAVVLRYFADMPILQIARFLTIPVGTVNSRLHLARMALSMRLGAKLKKPAVALIAAALFLAASAAVAVGVALSGGESPVVPVEKKAIPMPVSTTSQGEEQMKTNAAKSALLGIAAAALAGTANAAPAVTIDSVAQRWPWNNKVDITYTVAGGQTRSAGVYCALRFAMTAKGQTYSFEGYTVGASAENGQHTVTWTAPEGIVSDACSMTATLFTTNVPSGNDYMIVDLTSGAVTYEGLFASQAESNSRYNVTDYKTDKMVLRKIPRTADSAELPNGPFASGYPTGDSVHYPSGSDANSSTIWTVDRNYYIGVFPVTQYQYRKLYGSNPSKKTSTISGNTADYRPVEYVSWDDLRLPTTASTSSIPVVASNSGTFFQRLNYIAGNGYGFDLPTEVMFEIAERAGATTTYSWGDAMVTDYVVCSDNCGESTVAVGSRLPNNWGLYDMAGNVWEWCRDGKVNGNLTMRTDALTPAWSSGEYGRYRGGGSWGDLSSVAGFRASARSSNTFSKRSAVLGFRVSMIAD
ncbi:MAG: sigma-70 family RNA polymerase sigma factor [Kiritimatiellae bacterium]|nr:sigma-70 family RNA polymerase sigma factor [Kiritimatiellia bacterium]